jgi:hypothetical protein
MMDRSRVETILCWPGRVFFYSSAIFFFFIFRRRFVNNHGKIAMGLTDLVKGGRMFVLDDMAEEGFEGARGCFLTGPLCIFDLIL